MAKKAVVEPTDDVTYKNLADAVVTISKAMKRLTKSGLNRKAIVVLIADDTRLPRRDINAVLDSIETLAEVYSERV
jgi:hypothetical protein